MTTIAIRVDHQNLPLTRESIFDARMSSDEIGDAVERFEHELSIFSDDDALTVTKSPKSVIDQVTIFFISSALDRGSLVAAIERTMNALKLGGAILDSTDEFKVGGSDDRFIDSKI